MQKSGVEPRQRVFEALPGDRDAQPGLGIPRRGPNSIGCGCQNSEQQCDPWEAGLSSDWSLSLGGMESYHGLLHSTLCLAVETSEVKGPVCSYVG